MDFILSEIAFDPLLRLYFLLVCSAFSIIFIKFYGFILFLILLFLSTSIFFFFREPYNLKKDNFFKLISPCSGYIFSIESTNVHPISGSMNEYFNNIQICSGVFDYFAKFAPISGKIKKINWIGPTKRSVLITINNKNHDFMILFKTNGFGKYNDIVLYINEGEEVKAGDKICNISFGSVTNLYVPSDEVLGIKSNNSIIVFNTIVIGE